MPSFSDYRHISVEIDISVKEFFYEMDDRDKKEMLSLLKEDDFEADSSIVIDARGVAASEFGDSITKIVKNYHSLSNEETDIINRIASRF